MAVSDLALSATALHLLLRCIFLGLVLQDLILLSGAFLLSLEVEVREVRKLVFNCLVTVPVVALYGKSLRLLQDFGVCRLLFESVWHVCDELQQVSSLPRLLLFLVVHDELVEGA